MSYLTGWRIALAADLLRETSGTVEAIARRVGYANAFALSVAFKRVRGTSPTAHRRGPLQASA
jgi:transcriptional regulator GlxA family with amidase domain